MPQDSKKLIMKLSDDLKSFNDKLIEMEKNPENMNQVYVNELKKLQNNISTDTRRYLNALHVDPKILNVITKLIKDRKIKYEEDVEKHKRKRNLDLLSFNIKSTPSVAGVQKTIDLLKRLDKHPKPPHALYEGDNLQQKQDIKDVAFEIRKAFSDKGELGLKYETEVKLLFFEVSPSPIETIRNIRNIFATLSKNPNALRLEESKKPSDENLDDLQKLQILWQGASIIADESTVHYFKRNLLAAAAAIIGSAYGGIVGVFAVLNMVINAVVKAAELAVHSIDNLLHLNPRDAALDIGKSFGVLITATIAAIPLIVGSFYTYAVSTAQAKNEAAEEDLLDQALKKIIAVFDAVDTIEKKLQQMNQQDITGNLAPEAGV